MKRNLSISKQIVVFLLLVTLLGTSLSSVGAASVSESSAAAVISAVAVLNTVPGQTEAENYTNMYGIQTECCSEGGLNVGYIDSGDWMDYNLSVATAGIYTVEFRMAGINPSGLLQIQNLSYGPEITSAVIPPNTGGWQNWVTVKTTVTLSQGATTLRMNSTGENFNINWIKFSPYVPETPTPQFFVYPGFPSADNGTYAVALNVGIAFSGAGDIIRYTTDGSTPNANSPVFNYDNPIYVPNTTTIKAYATKEGWMDSAVVSSTYNIDLKPVFNIQDQIEIENYSAMKGIQTETCSTGGLNIGYIDEGDWVDFYINTPMSNIATYTVEIRMAGIIPTGTLELQNADGTVLATITPPNTGAWQTWQTVKFEAPFQNLVTIYAGIQKLRLYSKGNDFNINWIKFTAQKPVAYTPQFSVAPGTYTSAQSITLTCDSIYSVVYYTTDGSTPTDSSNIFFPNSDPIIVSSTTTINAVSAAADCTNSEVVSATYVIN